MNGLRLAISKTSQGVATGSSTYGLRWGRRHIHKRRPLPYPIDEGLGEFLPPHALKVVAEDFQNGLLDRLNDEVRDTDNANKRISDIVINTAPHRDKTLAFNYASLALNNSFFLDHLKPPPKPPANTHEAEISDDLLIAIRNDYGSLQELKSAFSAAALGMSTSGWVWFVTDSRGNTGILPTFGPGTLLIRSRMYVYPDSNTFLGEDMGNWMTKRPLPTEPSSPPSEPTPSPVSKPQPPGVAPSSPTSGVSGSQTPSPPKDLFPRYLHHSTRLSSYYKSGSASKVELINIGEKLLPLFCISVHEHAWMSAGYGVWGKEEWLKKFWTVVDWDKVSKAYKRHATQPR